MENFRAKNDANLVIWSQGLSNNFHLQKAFPKNENIYFPVLKKNW